AVVHGDPDERHPVLAEEARVVLTVERRQEALEEAVCPVLAENLRHGAAHEALIRGIPGDEILHVQPAADAHPGEPDRFPVPVDELATLRVHETGGTLIDHRNPTSLLRNIS